MAIFSAADWWSLLQLIVIAAFVKCFSHPSSRSGSKAS
jgi:hypothetical protein